MNLSTPTTQSLSDNIVAQLEAAFSQTIPLLPKTFARVLAKVLAAVVVLVYKYAGFNLQQQFIVYATANETEVNGKTIRPLVEWGNQIGVGEPLEGARAELVVEFPVLTQTGSLAADTQLVRAPTGVLYLTVAAVTLDAATKQVTVRASSDPDGGAGVGEIGNLEAGDTLEFSNPPAAIGPEATVISTAVIGEDAETVEDYRARVLARSQRKPQGGAYADYRIWAETVAGVENIYPYTGSPGEVDVYVECTVDADEDGIPDQDLLDSVSEAIELDSDGLASNRNANAAVNVLPITRIEFDVVVGGLDAPDEAAAQEEIEDGIDEHLRSREPFIVGLSVLPRLDMVSQGAIGGVVHEIVSALGGTVTTVELRMGLETIPAHVLGPGVKAKLGTVTFE